MLRRTLVQGAGGQPIAQAEGQIAPSDIGRFSPWPWVPRDGGRNHTFKMMGMPTIAQV